MVGYITAGIHEPRIYTKPLSVCIRGSLIEAFLFLADLSYSIALTWFSA